MESGNSEIKIAFAIDWERLFLLGSNQQSRTNGQCGVSEIPFGCTPCMAHPSGCCLGRDVPHKQVPPAGFVTDWATKLQEGSTVKTIREQTSVLILLRNVLLGGTGLLWDSSLYKNGVHLSIYLDRCMNIYSGFAILSISELAFVGLWWITHQIPFLAACTASLYLLSETSMLDLNYLDLTDNSAHKCFPWKDRFPLPAPLVVPPTTCYPPALQESHINSTHFLTWSFPWAVWVWSYVVKWQGWTRKYGSSTWVCFSWNLPGSMNFSAYATILELSDLAEKNANITFSTTAACEPQLPFASSSADQIHIESQNNSGCKGLHNFNGIFNLSKLQSLTRLQRSGNRRKGSFSFVLQFVTWFGDLWFFFCLYPRTVGIKDKWSKRCVTTQRNRV